MSLVKIKNCRPFLKWAGGKFRLLEHIRNQLPNDNGGRFIEPFVGGGSVFSNLQFNKYIIADKNPDLIDVYKHLKREGRSFIDFCGTFFTSENNCEEQYYSLRNLFNSTSDKRLKSALFVFFNRHSYNGLVRYNQSGEYNVPFGRYKKPYFAKAEMLLFIKKLKSTTILNSDYRKTLMKANPFDVVYLDPPFVPLSKTSNFTEYSSGGFSESDQIELAEIAQSLGESGVTVIVSNHDTKLTRQLYSGAEITSFYVQRNISCKGQKRKRVKELIAYYEAKI